MSPETKEAIQEIKREVDKKVDELKNEHIRPLFRLIENLEEKHDNDMSVVNTKIETKVSFKLFTWVLGILMLIVIGIQGVVWFQVKETYEKANEVNTSVSLIQYQLNQFEAVK